MTVVPQAMLSVAAKRVINKLTDEEAIALFLAFSTAGGWNNISPAVNGYEKLIPLMVGSDNSFHSETQRFMTYHLEQRINGITG